MFYPLFIRGAMAVTFLSFMLTRSDQFRAWSALLFTGFFVLTVYNHLYYIRAPRKLGQKLQELSSVGNHSLDKLKAEYGKMHKLHGKLHPKHQKKFHGSLQEVRERIERKLKAGKKIEELLLKVGNGNFKEQRNNYEEMFSIYQKLPKEIQKEYYAKIMHARDQLEKGYK